MDHARRGIGITEVIRSAVFIASREPRGIELKFNHPGKPKQNAFIESFNRTYRHEVLRAHIFENLNQVKEITRQWIMVYNEDRPLATLRKFLPLNHPQQENFSLLNYYQLKIFLPLAC